MKKKHKFCPKCLTNIVRIGAGPKELCGICDPEHNHEWNGTEMVKRKEALKAK